VLNININSNIYRSIYIFLVFSGAWLIAFRELIPIVILIIFLTGSYKGICPTQFSRTLKVCLKCLIIFIPILFLTNYLSGFILVEYSLQNSVSLMLKEEKISHVTLLWVVLFGPLIEEIYFRELLYNYLKNYTGIFWAILLLALYFSIIHLNIIAAPTLFILGIFLGVLRFLTKTVFFSILMHSVFNIIMILLIL